MVPVTTLAGISRHSTVEMARCNRKKIRVCADEF